LPMPFMSDAPSSPNPQNLPKLPGLPHLPKPLLSVGIVLLMIVMAAGVIFMLTNPIGVGRRASPEADNSAPVDEISPSAAPAANEPSGPADEAIVIEEETVCNAGREIMNVDEAESLAATGECGQAGRPTGEASCNNVTSTWWLDLTPNEPKSGCNPACVVHVADKSVEVNWRCTGAIPPAAPGAAEPGATGAGETGSAAAEGPSLCAGQGSSMSYDEARVLAAGGECGQVGLVGTDAVCNPNSVTWWFDLEPNEPKSGCNPACVVRVADKSVEVNWRCTGLMPPR
jgi:hypothetical protein